MPVPTFPIDLGPIILRPFEESDFEQFWRYRSLPEVARYVRWEAGDRDDAVLALTKRVGHRSLEQPGDVLAPAIVAAETGALIGEAMLAWAANEHRQGEVGFGLHPAYQGKGYARAAAAQMLRIGFDELDLHRIHGGCDPRNGPSAALMRRLGMREEANLREVEYLKGEWCDEQVFAILAADWRG